MRSLDRLFTPFQLDHLTLRNRFVMPAMVVGNARDGVPILDRVTPFYRDRAAGGAALVFSGGCTIDHPSAFWKTDWIQMTRASEDAWRRVVDGVKAEGVPFALQLWHPGAIRMVDDASPYARHPSLSPSGRSSATASNGRAMTAQEVEDIKAAYIAAAERAKRIGFDGVELHGGSGCLLDQFLWSATNLREDRYGGPAILDRATFPVEVAAGVRRAVGDDFLISYRLSQFKEQDFKAKVFANPDEFGQVLGALRGAGVNCFCVSTRRYDKPEWPDLHPTRGLAGWAKQFTDAAVITGGAIGVSTDQFDDLFDHKQGKLQIEKDFDDVVSRFDDGEFDLVAIGRGLIANSDFVDRLRTGTYAGLESFRADVHLKRVYGETPNFDAMDHLKDRKAQSPSG